MALDYKGVQGIFCGIDSRKKEILNSMEANFTRLTINFLQISVDSRLRFTDTLGLRQIFFTKIKFSTMNADFHSKLKSSKTEFDCQYDTFSLKA